MDQAHDSCHGLQYIVAIMAALNVALNTWLVNRRSKADKREHEKNGNGHAQHSTVANKLYPSESARSAPRSTPKD